MKLKFWWRFSKVAQFFILFAVIGLFSNCVTTSKTKIPDISNLTPAYIQAKVSRNLQHLNSFEGKARVIIQIPGSGYNGFSKVYINLPDSIFVKTEAIMGIDIGELFLDHRYFGAYAPRENTLYYGEIELLDLRDFLQVELDTDELFEVFTGLLQIPVNHSSKLNVNDGQFLISTPSEQGEVKYWIDPQKYVVTKSQIVNADGEILLTKEFRRFKVKKGLVLPQIIKLTRPQAREQITVYYTKQKLNQKIPSKKFKIKFSKNAKKIYWGDMERPVLERGRPKK